MKQAIPPAARVVRAATITQIGPRRDSPHKFDAHHEPWMSVSSAFSSQDLFASKVICPDNHAAMHPATIRYRPAGFSIDVISSVTLVVICGELAACECPVVE